MTGSSEESLQLAQVERTLADTVERYRSLFDYNPHAVFSLDLTGRFVASNAASEQLCGYSLEELAELEMGVLIVPSRALETAAAFAKALNRESHQLETALVHKDGHVVEVSITGLPIIVDGGVVGVYCIAEDITARKKLEHELVRTQLAAEQASEAKSRFMANVSHEIRTPLTSLLGTTEVLLDTDLDPLQTKFVDTMIRSGDRLLALVNDLLDFAKIEAGMARADELPIDVRALVTEVGALLSAAAEKKGLEFELSVDPELPEVLTGDPARIMQVLTNLLDNAVKFTEIGRVRLSVSYGHEPGRPEVTFAVQDAGIGISEQHLEGLFESFNQADPSITRKYGGTGLGLALSKQLVELMGGTIGVESVPGVGSTFTVVLPAQRRTGCVASDDPG
ncbi:MAG: ATP-binding protein [Aeromicrobium sp.]